MKIKKNSSKSNDISIPDQTVSLTDSLQTWNQMDNLTKFLLCFAALASLFALDSVASPLLNRR